MANEKETNQKQLKRRRDTALLELALAANSLQKCAAPKAHE
jgi:hypothetical protein